MADNTEFKYGDILEVKRGPYSHYGVYSGNNNVIHYTGDSGDGSGETNPFDADIKETSLKDFQKGNPISVDNREEAKYSRDEIVRRARSLIGTQKGNYDLVTNNCEHFANYCKTGKKISNQVNNVRSILPPVIYDTYTNIAPKIKSIFSGTEEDTYNKIGKKTKEILQDYNQKAPEMTRDNWIGKIFQNTNPVLATEDYVKSYIDDVNNEISIYDSLKTEQHEAGKKGISIADWFRHKVQDQVDSSVHILDHTHNNNISKSDKTDILYNSIEAESSSAIQKSMNNEMQRTSTTTIKNIFSNINTKDENSIRNTKVALATALKIASSSFLHFDVPNTITVPISCASVDIGASIKRCTEGEITPLKCMREVSSSLATGSVQIIKRTSESIKKSFNSLLTKGFSKLIGKVTGEIAGNSIRSSPKSISTSKELSSSFSTKAQSCMSKVITKVKNVFSKAKTVAKNGVKKLSGGRKK